MAAELDLERRLKLSRESQLLARFASWIQLLVFRFNGVRHVVQGLLALRLDVIFRLSYVGISKAQFVLRAGFEASTLLHRLIWTTQYIEM